MVEAFDITKPSSAQPAPDEEIDFDALSVSPVQKPNNPQEQKTDEEKKQTEHFIKHLPVRWWLRVLELNKKHRQSNIVTLASAIVYLNGMKYNHGLDAACLKKFKITRSSAYRNLQLLEAARLVVVERMTTKNRPPIVTPLFNTADIGKEDVDDANVDGDDVDDVDAV